MTWRALSLRPSALAAALAARAAFAPPTPDGWKKRCQPDCPVGYCLADTAWRILLTTS